MKLTLTLLLLGTALRSYAAMEPEDFADENADIVEFHTGTYCHAKGAARKKELKKIIAAVKAAHKAGLECHAGHGLSYDTVADIARIKEIVELNIGHFLIGEAIYIGLDDAIKKMRKLMDQARK